MTTPPFFVVDDPLFDEHVCLAYHPERPERLGAARRAVGRREAEGARALRLEPRDATDDEIARVHDPALLARLEGLRGRHGAIDADTYVAPKSVEAARRAAGGAVALVDALLSPGAAATQGVALLRPPPGHHATFARSMGFCLLNNVAVAAAHALSRGLARVAIVDYDVHHGNGTQDIFERDGRVLYVSLHESPLYPGTGSASEVGKGDGRGRTVNVPLGSGATPAVYALAFERVVLPALAAFAPELVLVSAGFDAHARDPLASMALDDAAYGAMTRALAEQAETSAAGRIGLVLEGGYDLGAVEGALHQAMRGAALEGVKLAEVAGEVGEGHRSEIESVVKRIAGA